MTVLGVGIVQLCNVGTFVEGQSCDESVAVLGVGIVQLCNVDTVVEGQSCDDTHSEHLFPAPSSKLC